jgi:hypothetical protein
MTCNCESENCHHAAGGCKLTVGKARALYVGPVCDTCAPRIRAYLLADESGAETSLAAHDKAVARDGTCGGCSECADESWFDGANEFPEGSGG